MNARRDHSAFDQRVDRYDALIDWPRRLGNETNFYRNWFERADVRRVLDAACGTGRHASMFHEWGLEVEGADVSPGMIAHCRQVHGEPAGLRWVERPYTRPTDPPASFDAVLCVGNSLALTEESPGVETALRAMIDSLRPGGVCIVQVLNLWRLPDGPTQWRKCVRVPLAGGDHVLLKSIRRVGERAFIDFVDIELTPDGGMTRETESDSFIGLRADDLRAAAEAAGAGDISFFGNYQQQAYDPATCPDLILVCRNKPA
ncbi:MAG TPA: class I SAM-dependent methyltransferase [Phycisphaerae bacterium]|nr:class I SAM-dependent methyltransferase [Phycisphaerae bacterium]